jgi:membrane protease YdiL (CAAX protease family)
MTGFDDEPRTPSEPASSAASAPVVPPVGAAPPMIADPATAVRGREPLGQRIARIVTGLGLVGAAVGAGWFAADAQLGISAGLGLGGMALVLAAAVLLGIGLLLVLGGLGYYVFAPAFAGRAAARRNVGSHRLVIASTILIVLLANVGPLVYTAIFGVGDLCSIGGFTTAALSVDVALVAVAYFRFMRPGVLTVADLGVTPSRLPKNALLGLGVGVAVLVASAAIQATMQALGVQQTQLMDLQCVRDFPFAGFLLVVFAGGVLAPIAEELYFRGFVFRSYMQTKHPAVAYIATSLLFAMLHLNLPALLPILVMSLIFCYAYKRTGSIVPSVVGHSVNNVAAFSVLYFSNPPL